ncbi:hypothetical protein GCM10027605_02200 [Micromonospora zhanjiangensis]
MCIEELWASRPPRSAVSTLQTYILQIRRMLRQIPGMDGTDMLLTRHHGYQLVAGREEVDLLRFKDRVAEGGGLIADGDYALGAGLLREALGYWRGPVLVDVQAGPIIATHLPRLEELRFSVLEQRIEAELALGLHHELISELSGLVSQFRTHENLCAQLMVALCRSGRQAEALQTYRQFREALIGELGIEPSSRIQQLHQAVLTGDPVLNPPPAHSGIVRSLDLLERGAMSRRG